MITSGETQRRRNAKRELGASAVGARSWGSGGRAAGQGSRGHGAHVYDSLRDLNQVTHSTLADGVARHTRAGRQSVGGARARRAHASRRVIPDPGFAGDDGSAAPPSWPRRWPRATPTRRRTPRRSRVLPALPPPGAGRRGARRGRVRRRRAGPREGQRHGDRADPGRRRPAGAARLHRHRGPRRLGPRGPPGAGRGQVAARSALQDGAAALVVDVAGPVRFVVEGDDLRGLAEGWTLARVAGRRRLDSARPGIFG